MNKLCDTMEKFRSWVEAVENASQDGLQVICDAVFIRHLYEEINAGIGQGINSSLSLVLKAQKDRDDAIARSKGCAQ